MSFYFSLSRAVTLERFIFSSKKMESLKGNKLCTKSIFHLLKEFHITLRHSFEGKQKTIHPFDEREEKAADYSPKAAQLCS